MECFKYTFNTLDGRKLTFPKNNIDFLKSENVHRNIFHASDPAIRPYIAKKPGLGGFGGFGDFAVFYSIYIPIDPVWGLVLG